jgi:hypothetical protein
VEIVAPLHFLITCSGTSLKNFERAKPADVNNLRSKFHRVLDDLMDASNQTALARLFRAQGRMRILRALESTPDPIAEAKVKMKNMGRTPEDFAPLLSLPPGQAHRTAAITYQRETSKRESAAFAPCRSHGTACATAKSISPRAGIERGHERPSAKSYCPMQLECSRNKTCAHRCSH